MAYRNSILATIVLLPLAAACSSDTAESGRTAADGVVKTTIAMNVAMPEKDRAGAPTRMSGTVTQSGETASVFRGISDIRLIPFGTEGLIGDNDEPMRSSIGLLTRVGTTLNYSNENSVELQTGTASFLAYARATATDGATDSENGCMVESVALTDGSVAEASDITFTLKHIKSDDIADGKATAIAQYLTRIANTDGWSDITSGGLKNLRVSFLNEGNIFAGSSANIRATVSSLYKQLKEVEPDESEADVRDAIISNIKGTESEGIIVSTGGVTWLGEAMEGYPANIGLPDGAAAVKWNGTAFEPVVSAEGQNMNAQHRYAYPPELYYYANTRIKTSEKTAGNDMATSEWDAMLGDYENDDATVTWQTRRVALKEPLNYAVARLDLRIVAESNTLKDALGIDRSLTNGEGEASFPLTAIMIAGQQPQTFNFKPQATADASTESIVFDKHIDAGIAISTQLSARTHTLLLQTKDDVPVNIVLEFENNSGQEFYGYEEGIVYPGTKFYLAAMVTTEQFSEILNDYQKRVLTKDHITALTMRIGSLKSAYNVIPDIKSAAYEVHIADAAFRQWSEASSQHNEFYNW